MTANDDIRIDTITGPVGDDLRRELVEVYASAYPAAPYERSRQDADRWGADVLTRHLVRRGRVLVVARQADAVVGFGYSMPAEDGEWFTAAVLLTAPIDVIVDWHFGEHVTLVELAVVPEARGRGVGRALLTALMKMAPVTAPVLLGVDAAATAAQALLRSVGFVDVFSPRPAYQVLGLRPSRPGASRHRTLLEGQDRPRD